MATTREPYTPFSPAPPTAPYGGPDAYQPDLYADDAVDTWQQEEEPADGHQQQRRLGSRVDEWMDKDFKFGGSRVKRKAVALILLGARSGVARISCSIRVAYHVKVKRWEKGEIILKILLCD